MHMTCIAHYMHYACVRHAAAFASRVARGFQYVEMEKVF